MFSRFLSVWLFGCVATLLTFSASASAQTGDWTLCAGEGEVCRFSGTQEVRYGADGSYVHRTLTDGTACTNGVFGDPIVGTYKSCAIRANDWTFCTSEYGFCSFAGSQLVRYGANGAYYYKTLFDGTACTNSVFGDPIVGTFKECHIGGVSPTLSPSPSPSPPPPPPPSISAVGPQSTITCPAGAVDIWPGVNIQTVVNSYGGNTTFCLRVGTHSLRSSITPKTGNTFVGEYGAVLDGTGWATSDRTQAAFRAQNEDIDYVTIRNLVIRNMPQRGIHAYHWMSDHWTIEYNEVTSNSDMGVHFVPYSVIRNNYIHHNGFAGYFGASAHNSTLENNEIAYNGHHQKIGQSANVTFRNNFVHHNSMGIWYDWENTGGLVEGNRVEDNGASGIQFEVSMDGIVRNNIVRRSGQMGVYISTSKNMQVYNNTLEHNFRGIQYFINCAAIGGGRIAFDLANVSTHDNTVVVGTQSGAWASLLSYSGDCTSTQLAPYLNGSKNVTFSRNTYRVPSLSAWYWVWGAAVKYWNEWQALGHDVDGTVSQ